MTPKYREQLWNSINPNLMTVRELIIDYERTNAYCDRLAERVKELESWIDKGESPMLQAARKELAIAEADNAALLDVLKGRTEQLVPELLYTYANVLDSSGDSKIANKVRETAMSLYSIMNANHPGTALTQRLAGTEKALSDLRIAVLQFCEKADYTPPWESSGEIWGEMCRQLNNARLDSLKAQQALEGKEAPHG